MVQRQHWPERMWLVRHGQSEGNLAGEAARKAGASVIDLDLRDVDIPLSNLGHQQADATGRWFAALPDDMRPEVLLTSPYLRARQTAEAICAAGGLAPGARGMVIDERLREREFGVFDGLTPLGIKQKFPEEAAHRAKLGKFYHRAPGGESWADVILRLRSVLNTINLQYADRRVLVVAHQVVVTCFRYIFESLTEEQIMEINRQGEVLNCGISAFDFPTGDDGIREPKLAIWNLGESMLDQDDLATAEPEAMTGSR